MEGAGARELLASQARELAASRGPGRLRRAWDTGPAGGQRGRMAKRAVGMVPTCGGPGVGADAECAVTSAGPSSTPVYEPAASVAPMQATPALVPPSLPQEADVDLAQT